MAGRYIDSLQGIKQPVFFVLYLEHLSVLPLSQFLQDLVVPESTSLAHMTSHLFYLINRIS
jgi:hypothetical protein